ncbi:MAG: SDR family oxidoreductase [Proteobacteria bacterium]|nr:SDR family oxidoreductase [Pseudomonadota bacterium]MBI3496117.1 SDR family oxidoreductase [Pseudomonadota bacterium]
MDLKLKGRKAIVTGGSRGIGRAIAEFFADEGCDVGICARGEAGVKAAVTALEARGVKAVGEAVDVANGDSIRRWVANMDKALGGFDVYVSNVSALSVAGADEAGWRHALDVDIMGSINGVEAALPVLERSSCASVVFIATTGAVQVYGPRKPYPSVKSALLAYMKHLSHDVAAKGIRVNAVSPGSIYFEGGVWDQRKKNEPERYARMLALNPLGRFGKPEEIAAGVVFLSSPLSGYTSGTNLVIDGASTVRIQN